ncbi:hypothetical protein KIW84_060397 [Lathyrus oleraceus]|uniref:Uncharacterized protein n=1 Tax=Pisum sativum TaxID=3888 RepID=A0A9D5A2S5_PEA|nr:hypothetical protein KIW84_060397 [Pisum sativum]
MRRRKVLWGQTGAGARDNVRAVERIVNWRACLKFPEEPKISAEAKDLICSLLCDVDTRLGTRGVDEIKVKTPMGIMFVWATAL